jgi:hypothetical protein
VIDLTNYKDRVGTRVAPGRYRVQVEDVEQTESSNKNPMINLWFRVLGGDFDGATITDRLVLTEKSLFRVVGFMGGIGLPTPRKRLKLNIRQFVGRTLDIEVEDGDPYNGRVRSEVRGYFKVARAETADDAGAEDEGDEDASAEASPTETPAPSVDVQKAAESVAISDQSTDTPADSSDEVDLDSVEL